MASRSQNLLALALYRTENPHLRLYIYIYTYIQNVHYYADLHFLLYIVDLTP